MSEEPLTLIERLLNPQWVHGPDLNSEAVLDKNQTLADMKEAAELLSMKIPCDVHLPPRTFIRKGSGLETVIVGIKARSGMPDASTTFPRKAHGVQQSTASPPHPSSTEQ